MEVQVFIMRMKRKQRAAFGDELMEKFGIFGFSELEMAMVAGSPISVLSDYARTVILRGSIQRAPVQEIDHLMEEHIDVQNKEFLDAAKIGNQQKVGGMLQVGASVNVKDRDGKTALQWAAHTGNETLTQFLLDNRAAVNQPEMFDFTSLMEAIAGKHEKVIALLLAGKADVAQKNMCGVSSVQLAEMHEVGDAIMELLRGPVAVKEPEPEDEFPKEWELVGSRSE